MIWRTRDWICLRLVVISLGNVGSPVPSHIQKGIALNAVDVDVKERGNWLPGHRHGIFE